jgi:two-component system, cell cycle sensor histidine kinase and response regulator CckA
MIPVDSLFRKIARRLTPRTLRGRLLVTLILMSMLPLVVIAVTSARLISSSIDTLGFDKYNALLEQAGKQTTSYMTGAVNQLKSLAERRLITEISQRGLLLKNKESVQAEMKRIVDDSTIFQELSIFDHDGCFLISASGTVTQGTERTVWSRNAAKGVCSVSVPQRKLGDDNLCMSIYVNIPASERDGRYAIVRAEVSFQAIQDVLGTVRPEAEGYVVLLDHVGNAIAGVPNDQLLQRWQEEVPLEQWSSYPRGLVTFPDSPPDSYTTIALEPHPTLQDRKWRLISITPARFILEAQTQTNRLLAILGLITFLLAVGVSLFWARLLGRPIEEVAKAARKLAAGNESVRFESKSGMKEISYLSTTFNQMAEEVALHRSSLMSLVDSRTQDLKKSESRAVSLSAELRAALEASRDGMLFLDTKNCVIAANVAFGEFFAIDSAAAWGTDFANWSEVFFDCFEKRADVVTLWSKLPEQEIRETEWQTKAPRRRILSAVTSPVTNDGQILGRLWVFRDLTKQRELQESLDQSQKMDAIGRLAGGVAHDFNNLLTGIIGNLRIAEDQLGEPSLHGETTIPREHLGHATGAAERAAHLVKGLLSFSRQSALELRRCDLNDIVERFLPLVRRTIDPRIAITFASSPALWPIKGDPTKLEQVLMNLCVNARDAIVGEGSITIITENSTVDRALAEHHQAQAGEYVRLSVVDTGTGISPETMRKIFEPFFTTKEQGKGTGIGLATCFGIAQHHEGWLDVESQVGVGTTFHVYFPACLTPPETVEEVIGAPVVPKVRPVGRGETVLIVDDELVVRAVAEAILRKSGYQVITASDGLEAVERYRADRSRIDLILMDMTMPRLNGHDAFRQIREIGGNVPVLICSGYLVDDGEFKSDAGESPQGFVLKPYDLDDMLHVVRETMDTAVAAAEHRP